MDLFWFTVRKAHSPSWWRRHHNRSIKLTWQSGSRVATFHPQTRNREKQEVALGNKTSNPASCWFTSPSKSLSAQSSMVFPNSTTRGEQVLRHTSLCRMQHMQTTASAVSKPKIILPGVILCHFIQIEARLLRWKTQKVIHFTILCKFWFLRSLHPVVKALNNRRREGVSSTSRTAYIYTGSSQDTLSWSISHARAGFWWAVHAPVSNPNQVSGSLTYTRLQSSLQAVTGAQSEVNVCLFSPLTTA